MLSVPAGKVVILSVATPEESAAVPMLVPLFRKVTFSVFVESPPSDEGDRVAVNVICAPAVSELALALRLSLVATADPVRATGAEVLGPKFASPS